MQQSQAYALAEFMKIRPSTPSDLSASVRSLRSDVLLKLIQILKCSGDLLTVHCTVEANFLHEMEY